MRCYFVTVHSNCPNILFCRACGKTAEMTPTPGTPRGERNSPPGSPAHRLTLCCRRWRQWLAPHRALHNLLALFCPLKRHVPSSDLCSVALACFLCVGLYPLGPERLQIWFPGQERGSPSLGLVSAPSSNATSSRKPAMADRRSRSLLYPPAPSTVFPGSCNLTSRFAPLYVVTSQKAGPHLPPLSALAHGLAHGQLVSFAE